MASTTAKPPSLPPSSGPSAAGDGKSGGLARAAATMIALTMLSRLLGMVRDIVIAHQLGVSVETDAYTAAFKVPDLLMYLIAGGALSSTFIPVFKEYLHQNKLHHAWQTFSVVATVTIVLAGLFVIVAEIFTPEFIRVMNPGYDPQRVAMTVPLTRIVLPAQIFFMLGGLMMGTLNARGQFLIPALAPSIYNLGIIFGAIFLYPHHLGNMGLPGLMWGALVGAFIGNFAMQAIPLFRLGVRYRPSLAILHPGAVKVWRMMGPIILGVSLPNVDQIINGYFASELSQGSQSALTFAVRIMLIPIGVFAQAMGIAILPTMSGQAAAGQMRQMRETINRGLRTIFFLTIPSSALLFLLSTSIVAALLQSGRFSAQGTDLTASALRFYSLGIFAWSAQAILTRGFYALQNSRIPVISGSIMTVVFILMNWYVVHHTHLDVSGLALSTSIAAFLHMLVMYVLLRRRMRGLQDARLYVSIFKTLLATTALCLVAWIVRAAVLTAMDDHSMKFAAICVLLIGGGLGITAFLATARLLGMEELEAVLGMVRRKIHRGAAS